MLGLPVSYHDLEAFDAGYYKNLVMILQHSLDDLGLELTFSTDEESTYGRPVKRISSVFCSVSFDSL